MADEGEHEDQEVQGAKKRNYWRDSEKRDYNPTQFEKDKADQFPETPEYSTPEQIAQRAAERAQTLQAKTLQQLANPSSKQSSDPKPPDTTIPHASGNRGLTPPDEVRLREIRKVKANQRAQDQARANRNNNDGDGPNPSNIGR